MQGIQNNMADFTFIVGLKKSMMLVDRISSANGLLIKFERRSSQNTTVGIQNTIVTQTFEIMVNVLNILGYWSKYITQLKMF